MEALICQTQITSEMLIKRFNTEKQTYVRDSKISKFGLSQCLGSGITHEEMVQESKRHWHRLEQNAHRQKVRI